MKILLLGKKEVINHKGKSIVAEKSMIDGIQGVIAIGQDTGFYGGNAKNVSKVEGYSAQWLILDKNNEVIDVAVDLDELNLCSKAQLIVFAERYGKLFRKEIKGNEKVAELLEFFGFKGETVADDKVSVPPADLKDEDPTLPVDPYETMTFDELVAAAELKEITFEDGIEVTDELLRESLRKED